MKISVDKFASLLGSLPALEEVKFLTSPLPANFEHLTHNQLQTVELVVDDEYDPYFLEHLFNDLPTLQKLRIKNSKQLKKDAIKNILTSNFKNILYFEFINNYRLSIPNDLKEKFLEVMGRFRFTEVVLKGMPFFGEQKERLLHTVMMNP